MIRTHEERAKLGTTTNDEPTETDQSGAAETDLNVILQRYAQSGTINALDKAPMYIDWTEYPEDFRGYLAKARAVQSLKDELPHQLKHMTDEQLLALTPEQIEQILKPADKPTEEQK